MGSVVQFPAIEKAHIHTNYGRTNDPASIIILPVVRIERCPEVLLQSDDPRERRRGRRLRRRLQPAKS